MIYGLFMLLQCTWGLGQTLVGFVMFIINIKSPHRFYRGTIETMWKYNDTGASLGLFIFTPEREDNEVRVHEYGHTFQSAVLGPLYAFVGIISVSWAYLPVFVKKRRIKKLPYTACFVEKHASLLGELFTGEKACR